MSAGTGDVSQITRLIKAAGISRLFWIDDKFGQRDLPRIARTIRNRIEVLWRLGPKEQLAHPDLIDIPVGSDPDDVEGRVLHALEEMRAKQQFPQEILDSIDQQIAKFDSTYPWPIKDLTENQFAEIESGFREAGVKVTPLSLNEWTDQRDSILSELSDDDLIFIDQDFSSEDGGDVHTGEEILSGLLSQPSQCFTCIFFTHAVGRMEVHRQRGEIASRIGMLDKQYRFTVVSKESLTATTGGGYEALTFAFMEALLRDWCFSVSRTIQQTVAEAFTRTSEDLLSLTADELATAFFRKAFSDGTLEPDALLRIFFLAARIKLQDDRPADVRLWKKLANIRNVLAGIPKGRLQSATNDLLKKWREREVFDPATVINKNFSPVFLGDVFRVRRGEKEEYYVLVAQPCDLIIRDTGLRHNTEALFLSVSDQVPKNEGFAYKFEFPELGTRWIRYANSIPVNLNLLDLVSFRDDGKLLFSRDAKASPAMLPGLFKKFEQLSRSFAGLFKANGERTAAPLNAKYQRLAMSRFAGGESPLKGSEIELPIVRVGRIRSPHAEAILGGFAIYHTRVAFDYDFADLSAFVDRTDEEKTNEPSREGRDT